MASPRVQLIFGGASLGPSMETEFVSLEETKNALSFLEAGGVKTIDTARVYPSSEEWLGQAGAAARFSINTKYPGGFAPEASSREDVIKSADESFRLLKTDQVDVYYIHAPDRRIPLEDLLAGLNIVYTAGKFKRLGLSNFLPEEVEEKNNYILPSVYQGNYNAVAHAKVLVSGGEGRWDPAKPTGGICNGLYAKPDMLEGLILWGEIASEAEIPKAELAYRWVAYHSVLKGHYFQIRRYTVGLKRKWVTP
ncbi:NADP-dependent oxidoreductase domain-containing protein [Aspergillus alliaceus]|uniref:NADP-dependent oxidoreductase domain-containing protein n=1 Tax=Petromyces alliaceus TaxID=209559 RepID=A0A5N7BSE9_PETAA|nr:NADP-dependent oxidoreductase domain-containing protein [Aspergillus alliaceus]